MAPWSAAHEVSPSCTISQSLLKVMSIDAIQLSHPLSHLSPPDLNLSQHKDFFPLNQLFAPGGQSIGASDSASILTMNIQD